MLTSTHPVNMRATILNALANYSRANPYTNSHISSPPLQILTTHTHALPQSSRCIAVPLLALFVLCICSIPSPPEQIQFLFITYPNDQAKGHTTHRHQPQRSEAAGNSVVHLAKKCVALDSFSGCGVRKINTSCETSARCQKSN